jgi:competence protein ComEA
MKQHLIFIALTTGAMLLSVNQSVAVQINTDMSQAVSGKVTTNMGSGGSAVSHKAAIKLVDINGATHKQLKRLPGIGDDEADKIIAGRPYGSKADLVTHNVIDLGVYEKIKNQVVARQSRKGGKTFDGMKK